MSTPHNQANIGEIAKVVLMPGDPLRAKYIAETFLEDVIQFNTIRNMFGYTGTYKGKKVSVMGSGMGMGSIGIYSFELYDQYGVDAIIRIGSAGCYTDALNVGEVYMATKSFSESTYALTMSGYEEPFTFPSADLNMKLRTAAKQLNIPLYEGGIHSSDVFYRQGSDDYIKELIENNCICCEMESFALFHNAKYLGKQAAALVTVSDSFATKEEMSAEDRQNSLTNMMKIALEAAIME